MRRFSADYLADTRHGLWVDREALSALDLDRRERILDVGSGTGAFARVLHEESRASVVCVDADRSLLADVEVAARVQGDAVRLPVSSGSVDLAACQALLVNLPRPIEAVRELARASSALVAAVEPDNAGVTVESTVDAEGALAAGAREAYLDGVTTDATLGSSVPGLFESAGLSEVRSTRHDHVREVAPPYDPRDVEAARRTVRASRLADHEPELRAGGYPGAAYDDLLEDWRRMGRAVVDQMRSGDYRRTETVPFYVTVGRV